MTQNTSTNRLELIAMKFRKVLGLAETGFVDAIDILQRSVDRNVIAAFRVVDDQYLPEVDAHWNPVDRTITLRRSVYLSAAAEEVRSRFVIAHELAHAILAHPVRNRRVSGSRQFGRYIEAHELEADELGAAILAPLDQTALQRINSAHALASEFGLPPHIADRRLVVLQKIPNGRDRREAVVLLSKRVVIIDTGDYGDALWAMSRNAERRSDE